MMKCFKVIDSAWLIMRVRCSSVASEYNRKVSFRAFPLPSQPNRISSAADPGRREC